MTNPAINKSFNFSEPVKATGHGVETVDLSHNLPHFLFIALTDADIAQRNQGASFLGDFKDELLPEKRFIVIEPTIAKALYEIKAHNVDEISNAFERTLPDGDHPSTMHVRNSAYSLTRYVQKEFEHYGVAVFEELIPHGEAAAREIFSIILRDGEIEPITRKFENIAIEKIFLDQIRTYLTRHGLKNATRPGLTKLQLELCGATLARLNTAVNRAWMFAQEKLSETHSMIRKRANGSPTGKDWYDMPDSRFEMRILPLDIVSLLETNTTPINLQEAEATGKIGRELGQSVREGMREGIKEAFTENETSEPGAVVSMDEVKQLLKEQEDKLREEFKTAKAGEAA